MTRLISKILVFTLFNSTLSFAAIYDAAVIGDAGFWDKNVKVVRDSIINAGITKLILPGDNIYDPFKNYDDVWNHWYKQNLKTDIVAIGNNNVSYQNEISYFNLPREFYTKLVAPGVRFIVLNSDNEETASLQASWFDSLLSKVDEPFVFIVFHHPPFTLTSSHRWEQKAKFHIAVRPIIWKYRSKVSALFLGHDHMASLLSFGDLPAIVSGAAYEQRKPEYVNNQQLGLPIKTRWNYDEKAYWTRLRVDTIEKTFALYFVRAEDNAVKCAVKFNEKGTRAIFKPGCNNRN